MCKTNHPFETSVQISSPFIQIDIRISSGIRKVHISFSFSSAKNAIRLLSAVINDVRIRMNNNVIPMFSFQDRDQVKELDRSHREIATLKDSVDLYRRKAREYSKENDALRTLVSHYKLVLSAATIPSINDETDITHPELLRMIQTTLSQLDSAAQTELSIISDVIDRLQKRCVTLEDQLSKINLLSTVALSGLD